MCAIKDLFGGTERNIDWDDPQEAAFLESRIICTSGKTAMLRHYNSNCHEQVKTDASDYVISGIVSQQFKRGRLHQFSFILSKLSPAELNNDVFNNRILAIAYFLRTSRHLLHGAVHQTVIYSDYYIVTYSQPAV